MKSIAEQCGKRRAFTIVELLTVMGIIVILIGLLVPAMSMVRRYATDVKQKTQFHSIGVAMELFNNDWEGYPPSDAMDGDTPEEDYCGAMKLCEAMVGQDLMGFHPQSQFRADCTDGFGKDIYATPTNSFDPNVEDLKVRRGPYLELERANAYRLQNIYGGATDPFEENLFVLCDEYGRVKNTNTGKKIGMPILYYKADTSNIKHDPDGPLPISTDDRDYIYNYLDNDELVQLGLPWDSTATHPMETEPIRFYENTKNDKIDIQDGRPYRPDSYILLSAGFDGEYGTADDMFNFEK